MTIATFSGIVKKGKGRGKDFGFPTANISLDKSIPEGIYLSKTTIYGKEHPSLTFIGIVKTFNETNYQAETYILNFDASLYDKEITIELLQKIRENKKFESKEELVAQMEKDKQDALRFFKLSG